jgi:cell wall-associated NlpC family hydrolase
MPFLAASRLRSLVLCPLVCCAIAAASAVPAAAQQAVDDAAPRVGRDAAKPFAAWSNSVHSIRDSLVAIARAQIGTKYVMGGTTPEGGFDCSGLVRYVMGALSVKLPRTARQQATTGLAVVRDPSRLRPGDLLTFGKGRKGVSHIGIYIGQGRYIHASTTAGQVIESDIARTGSPLIRAWRGVRRVVIGAEGDSARLGDG